MHLRGLGQAVLGFCYPGACVCCQAACPDGQEFCDECGGKLEALAREPACNRCAMPLAEWGAPCPYCMGKGHWPYDRVLRLGRFQDPIKELIHQLKYQNRWPVGEQLADRLLERAGVREMLAGAEILVPVPLHWWRHFRRGYNQAEVIAMRLRQQCRHLRIERPASRTRYTETQTALHSRARRMDNLRGAFRLHRPGLIAGKRIVVVDDVMTTAATLQSLGRELQRARPASLDALVVAIADPRGRDFQSI